MISILICFSVWPHDVDFDMVLMGYLARNYIMKNICNL